MSEQRTGRSVYVQESYPCGDQYEGYAVLDREKEKARWVKQGFGVYTFANHSVYEGSWKDGKMEGEGRFVEATSGDRFDGHWSKGYRTRGVYFFANGDQYQGCFVHKKSDGTLTVGGTLKHGKGVVWEDKKLYEVEYDADRLVSKVPLRHDLGAEKKAREEPVEAGSQSEPFSLTQEETDSLRAGKHVYRHYSPEQVRAAKKLQHNKAIENRQRLHAKTPSKKNESAGKTGSSPPSGTLLLRGCKDFKTVEERRLKDALRFYIK